MTPNSSRIWRPASFVLPSLHLTKKCVEPPDGVGGALTFNETLPCHRCHLIRSRSLNTPVRSAYLPNHGVLFGMTGAGKPGHCSGSSGTDRHRFDSGSSPKKDCRMRGSYADQGCQPVIIN